MVESGGVDLSRVLTYPSACSKTKHELTIQSHHGIYTLLSQEARMFRHFSKYLQSKSERPATDFSGVWVNELGSEMELTVNDGRVSGTYRTAVGKVHPTERFELTGFASGDRIVFCVHFGPYGTLGAWTGLHGKDEDKGEEEIYSLWHLPRDMKDDEEAKEYRWSAILTGVNIFKRKRAA
jgi:hypothetical protein